MNNNGQFYPGNVQVPTSACGAPSLMPGVAVYSPSVECHGAGYGASTFVSPATQLGIGLTTNVAQFRFAASTATRFINIGTEFSPMCLERIQDEIGGTVLNLCDDGVATSNGAGENFCCFLESGGVAVVGFVAKPSDSITELSGTQILFDPCNPCFASDTVFVCNNGCGDASNFILSNAVVGNNNAFILEIPADIALRLDICTCAPEVRSFATCPSAIPAVAQIASGVVCPPSGYAPTNGFVGNGNGGFANGRGF